MTPLAARDVTLRFGGVIALDGVTIEVRPDELRRNEDVREFYLGMTAEGGRKSYREVKHYRRRKRWLG